MSVSTPRRRPWEPLPPAAGDTRTDDPLADVPLVLEDRFAFFVAALERQLAAVTVTGRE